MRASKIFHKGENRIKVDFPYNDEIAVLLKQIEGVQWSKTFRAWHIPYNSKAFKHLISLFPQIEYDKTNSEVIQNLQIAEKEVLVLRKSERVIDIEVIGRRIFIKMPKNEIDIRFLRSFNYTRWDKKGFCWVVPHYPGNLELLKDYFKERITSLVQYSEVEVQTSNTEKRNISVDAILIIKTQTGRLKIIFTYNKELSKILNTIPYCIWNSKNKWWSIPYTENILLKITTFIKNQGKRLIYEEENVDNDKAARISPFDIPNYRFCPQEYILTLKELRYSERTLISYRLMFEEFINYYHTVDMNCINESMITTFLRYLVMERKVSTSYQNQSINAIKFYYEHVLGGQRKVYCVERPRVEKTLPEVLSEQEIGNLLNGVENLKHKAILMTTYAAGLRLSEILNLRIKDIDSGRMQIRIEQGKGKKDRYSILSVKLLEVLRLYFAQYKPQQWLFEGIAIGEKYSASSVQSILRDAVKKTGIQKKVTVHTLRHSFATHLLENGTDLRYIQCLLGHANSKTTEIYTHITTKGFDQIKSPLDKLNII